VHCFDGVATGFNADRYALGRGVTTVVDAGSTGFPMISSFVRFIAKPATTRIYAMVDIGATGTMLFREYPDFWQDVYNMHWVLPQLTAKAAIENKPTVVGIKAHLIAGVTNQPAEFELQLLKKALEAAETAQMPLMVHALNSSSALPPIVKLMRKGDVLTHCYHGFRGGSILDSQGKIYPEVHEARDRGVLFDVGEGHISFSFDVAEKALQQGFLPDSISTDLTVWATSHVTYDLPTVASKFLALGMDLDNVIERVTTNPSRTFDFGVQTGTLRPGAEADIGIFEVREGNFEFIDNLGEMGKEPGKRVGRQKLVNRAAVCRGQLFTNQV
jgi:dihydroorotase